jgi:hypothetical protein
MKKYSKFEAPELVGRTIAFFIIFYVLVLSSFSSDHLATVFNSAIDLFHQGELLGNVWHMLAYYQGAASFPVFIHGGMDYWPSLIAKFCFGDDHVIFGTRLIVVLVTLTSWLLFINFGISLLLKVGASLAQLLLFMGIFILTIPFSDFTVMAIEESPIGLRDAIILIQAYLLFKYWADSKIALRNYFLVFMFFLQPLGIYWAYDRGIASSLGCLVVTMMLLKQRKFALLSALFLASLLSLGLLEATHIGGSISENLNNILYWASHSKEVWGLPFKFSLGSIIFLMPIISLLLLAAYLFKKRADISEGQKIWLVFLFVVELVLLKSGMNRPRLGRVLMCSWPSILILMSVLDVQRKPVVHSDVSQISINFGSMPRLVALILLLIPIALFRPPFHQIKEFRKMVMNPPSDSVLAGGGNERRQKYCRTFLFG